MISQPARFDTISTARAVVSMCDRTGNAVREWARNGYECWCVDLAHPADRHESFAGGGIIHFVRADIRHWLPPRRDFAFAMSWSPCTDMAVSGARWFKKKGLRRLAKAIDTFGACVDRLEWCECPGFAENPVSVISSHYRKPDFTFQPWEYAGYLPDVQAENTTKRTCLWSFGGFALPPKMPAPAPHRNDCWLAGPSDDRADERAVTPTGFALAVFQAFARREGLVSA